MGLPTNAEQEMLERINRLRADPGGEFDRLIANAAALKGVTPDITGALIYFHVDLNLFRTQMAAYAAVAPLAWNGVLAGTAGRHSAVMIQQDTQTHQAAGEADLGQRITAAGYNYTSAGENIYAYARSVVEAEAGFVIDWGHGAGGMQEPAGHRQNLLSARYTEAGIDITAETNPATTVGPLVVTEDLGVSRDYAPQILGVVFRDANGDGFYTAGEGLGGVTVTASGANGVYATSSWSSGGYQLAAPRGTYTVSFSGAGLRASKSAMATLGAVNVKLDDNDNDAGTGAGASTSTGAGGNFTVVHTKDGARTDETGSVYTGPVRDVRYEYINITAENLNITATTPSTFIHTGGGADAINVQDAGGVNVLDGGTNSNFLVGGAGTGSLDTFFADDRAASDDLWSTIVNFHAGDNATIWGVTAGGFAMNWVNGEGAAGYTGLTVHATAPGQHTASMTLAGYTKDDLTNGRLTTSFGSLEGNDYMLIRGIR